MQARERVLSQSWISSTIWREGLRSRNPRPRPRVRAIGRALRAHFARPSRNAIESHLAGHQPASECTMRACMRESGRALGRRPVDMNGHVMSRSTYTSISMSTNPFIDMSIGAPAITARLISLHLISLRLGKVATGDRRAIKNGDATRHDNVHHLGDSRSRCTPRFRRHGGSWPRSPRRAALTVG
jgi:hypothetical protein